MPIRQLPPLLVNQIAAGEVIERPASVVKELIENSIDAGATRIDVQIEQGGRELVQVTDDGHGIPFDELPLALAAHATSKIITAADLDAIATMGFRGEALASIASVSRISIRSRTRDSEGAGLIEAEGDQVSEPRPAPGAAGTSITMRNLFFNTPARRRFLKSERAESGRVNEVLRGLALAHPSVGFTLTSDGKRRFDWPTETPIRARVLAVLGDELAPEMLEVDGRDGDIGVWGLAGTPQLARANTKHVHLILNGRVIADRTVLHAVREAYRGLIEPSRAPTIALYLEVDPARVDVNVHPAKAEVRFRDGETVHRVVRRAIKAALAEADLLPEIELPPTPHSGSSWTPPSYAASRPEMGTERTPQSRGFDVETAQRAIADIALPEPKPLPVIESAQPYLQVHSSFVVTEDEHGLLIIDQHALHERVMFEKLKERVERGTLESQRMLVPAVVETPGAAEEMLESLAPLLERLGIEAACMGPRSIAVHAFTSLLFERNVDPVDFMAELVDRASGSGFSPDTEAALHEVMDMMACKAAIKAGDRLAPREMADLLGWRERIERASNCPHGRPTTLRLTIAELERRFGRT